MVGGLQSSGSRVLPALLLGVLTLAAAGAGAAAGVGLRHAQVPLPPRAVPAGAPTPAAVRAATAAPPPLPSTDVGTVPTAAGVGAALAAPLADPRLGGRTLAQVVDVGSGATLFAAAPTAAAAPASTAKLTTAAAVLSVLTPTDRMTTRVTAGPTPGSVVLVGAGDPTLSAAAPGTPTPYADAARVTDLAAAAGRILAGRPVTTVYVDDALFTGPATAPGWQPEDAPSEYAAPITAALVDGGRDAPDAPVRSATPDLAAGRALAAALGAPGAAVVPVPPGTTGGAVLGSVQSAPVGELVEQMLQQSDNVLAECLARQVALARGAPASFAGAAAAVRAVLPAVGDGLLDGSGLSVDDRLTPAALTAVLTTTATTPRLHDVVAMLPVAGWNGTLRDRFLTAPESAGAGRVRAKTGTLTGVSSLAGLVVDRGGRLLAFGLLADQVAPSYAGTLQAETALDEVAAALSGCGCR